MTSHRSTKSATPDSTKPYGSDLNDQEFGLIAPHVAQKDGSGKNGRHPRSAECALLSHQNRLSVADAAA